MINGFRRAFGAASRDHEYAADIIPGADIIDEADVGSKKPTHRS